jgi:hypothetical protein
VAVENTKVERLIYTLLTSDAGAGGINTLLNGRIYAYTAPQKATYPVCIYEFRSGSDVQGIGTNRTLARVRYAVRVISKGAPGTGKRRLRTGLMRSSATFLIRCWMVTCSTRGEKAR